MGDKMILDISDNAFKDMLNDRELFLPHSWDGVYFNDTLEEFYAYYIKKLRYYAEMEKSVSLESYIGSIEEICSILVKSVNDYLEGFPARAYDTFKDVMTLLSSYPLKVYKKSATECFYDYNTDPLNLFRAVRVETFEQYNRTRVFHTPYNLRSKVSTCRYSIAGCPSLYLGTSLGLCCEEIHVKPLKTFVLASNFKLERRFEENNINIKVIELGLKPQDFVENLNDISRNKRQVNRDLLEDKDVRRAYLFWYPLISACSFIRSNKKDPFAAEYIIPQLLMQWVRNEIERGNRNNELIGIRYFSCASAKASDMGFNYVFPTSGNQLSHDLPYCSILGNAFKITEPIYIHEYRSIRKCEDELKNRKNFFYDFVWK